LKRVILPGAQALMDFQLVIVLTSTFEKLPDFSRLLHGIALLCVALFGILLIAPAALRRIVWAGEDSEALLRSGGQITAGERWCIEADEMVQVSAYTVVSCDAD
jgi:hypothetical protein